MPDDPIPEDSIQKMRTPLMQFSSLIGMFALSDAPSAKDIRFVADMMRVAAARLDALAEGRK